MLRMDVGFCRDYIMGSFGSLENIDRSSYEPICASNNGHMYTYIYIYMYIYMYMGIWYVFLVWFGECSSVFLGT